MNNLPAVSLVNELTAKSSPSVSEIVELFRGLQVGRILSNFVKVISCIIRDLPFDMSVKFAKMRSRLI